MASIKFSSAIIFPFGNEDYLAIKLDGFEQKRDARKFIGEMVSKPYVAEIKRFFDKRSLSANAYAWKIITEIANILRHEKDAVYLDMLKRYGQSEIVSVMSTINVTGYFKYYEEIGTGSVKGIPFTHYKVFKGSSEFDKREMAILIDGIVETAKELDIETRSPAEIERMKAEWQANGQ